MIKPAKALAVAGLLLAVTPVVSAEEINANTVVATVNDTEITLGHMLVMRRELPAEYQQIPAAELYNGILQQLITQTALSQSLQADDSVATRLGTENHRNALRASRKIDELLSVSVSEDALKEAYETRFSGLDQGMEYNASHILVETEDKAGELIAMLESGADFATLAKEHSTGPSGPGGGQLGWFGKGMMVPPFEEAVLALDAGQISAPVQTQFGWHVVMLNETRIKEAPTLEEMRGELTEELRNTRVRAAVDETVNAADVHTVPLEQIGAENIGNLELLED